MSPQRSVWIIASTTAPPRDLVLWVRSVQCTAEYFKAEDLRSPTWQLGPPARPTLVLLDVRTYSSWNRNRKRIEQWMLLLRERVWDSPVFLLIPPKAPPDYCRWGRFGATGVLPFANADHLDKALRPWLRRRDLAGPQEDIQLLDILRDTCSTLAVPTPTPTLWKNFLRNILEHFHAKNGSILLLDESRRQLIPLSSIGLPESISRRKSLPLEGSITDHVIHEDKALLLHGNLRRFGMSPGERRSRPGSALAVPLRFGSRVLGSLNVARSGRAPKFRRNDLLALEIVGTQVALAIENFRLIEHVRDNERLAVLGRTSADVSHCVKNIMTGFQGALYLLSQGLQSDDRRMIDESVMVLERSVDRVNLMVGDLLDVSKSRTPEPKPCWLANVFKEIENQIAYRCRELSIQYTLQLPTDLPCLLVEENRLFRALMNLAGNAMDALPAKGLLHISAEWAPLVSRPTVPAPQPFTSDPQAPLSFDRFDSSGAGDDEASTLGTLTISVADNGPGVPEDQKARIFEDFYSTKGSQGTGLGLAMVRKFVDESKGSLQVLDNPGGGTVFRLLLPAPALLPLV